METRQGTGRLVIPSPTMTVHADGSFRLESVCEIDGEAQTLYFEVKGVPARTRAEPFLCMLLTPAMKLGLDVVVHAPVSPQLLANLETLQSKYAAWWPDEFRKVSIVTDGVLPMEAASEPERGGCCCFSMGVDAFYSTLTHLDELTYLVYAHGFDTELDATDLRQRISAQAHSAAGELGKRLIEVETNGRLITDPIVWWGYQGGGFIGALAMLMSPVVNRYIVPPALTAEQMYPWSIHPEIDLLWSVECLKVESDALIARIDKVKHLAASPIALKYLRVCWDGRCVGYNCGKCPKCLRTQLALRIFCAEVPPGHFLHPLNLRELAFTAYLPPTETLFYQEALEALRAQPHTGPPLESALVAAIESRYCRGLWKVARQAVWRVKKGLRRTG